MPDFLKGVMMMAAIGTLAACSPSPAPQAQTTPAAPTGGAALLGAEWAVFEIAGKPIVADSKPTILFEDGRVAGAGSCNRFMGGYTVAPDGLKLEFSQMASTMMACPDPLMQQEGLFLKTLGDVTGYTVAADGVLTLTTADGRSIKARR
ncbi:META domain-containing protein [Sandaracinobacter sp. RS1-74]|uniref:META domain-containing protein n=1 Tax=Sandaracinobacteroides sayramensis TaxID=2913411 RepID=UPI001EDC8DF6|nr:META domain-containing protein [Sandaracinobacteroides sayramensis]MCG2842694.1 META domain-containing protein [Sandaracinobacteroides sayramensis]